VKKLVSCVVLILVLMPIGVGAQNVEKKARPAEHMPASWIEASMQATELHHQFLAKHAEELRKSYAAMSEEYPLVAKYLAILEGEHAISLTAVQWGDPRVPCLELFLTPVGSEVWSRACKRQTAIDGPFIQSDVECFLDYVRCENTERPDCEGPYENCRSRGTGTVPK
jgi:hypothetical protein